MNHSTRIRTVAAALAIPVAVVAGTAAVSADDAPGRGPAAGSERPPMGEGGPGPLGVGEQPAMDEGGPKGGDTVPRGAGRGGRGERRMDRDRDLADELGVGVDELRAARQRAHEALRDELDAATAAELGVGVDELDAARDAVFDARLDEMVAAGKLTAEQADRARAAYDAGDREALREVFREAHRR